MYAIVRSGGKQYRVEEKNILTVDKFEAEAGATMTLGGHESCLDIFAREGGSLPS